MSGMVKGFLITLALWAGLVGAYAGIELVRGNTPFAMLHWDVGGKFVTIVILLVLALGTAVGYASDRIQRETKRRTQRGRMGPW